LQEGFIERTIYNIIKRYQLGLPFEDLPRNGRPTSFDKKNLKHLQNAAANRVGVSQQNLARKFGVSQSTIHYNLKKTGLKYYKRQKAPRY
jgi:transposase